MGCGVMQTEAGYEARELEHRQLVLRPFLAYVQAHLGEPFRWGRTDCHTLALGWLDQLTAGHHGRLALGRYYDAASARAWARAAGRDIAKVIRDAGGCEVPHHCASAGDFLLVPDAGEPWHRTHLCAGAFMVSAWPGAGVQLAPMGELPEQYLVLRVTPCLR